MKCEYSRNYLKKLKADPKKYHKYKEMRKKSYIKLKSDPKKYKQYLEKKNIAYKKRMASPEYKKQLYLSNSIRRKNQLPVLSVYGRRKKEKIPLGNKFFGT